MKRVRTVALSVALAVVLVELAVLALGDAGSECDSSCTLGQRAADAVLVLIYIEIGLAVLVAVPLGLAYLVREGIRESRRTRD